MTIVTVVLRPSAVSGRASDHEASRSLDRDDETGNGGVFLRPAHANGDAVEAVCARVGEGVGKAPSSFA